MSQAHPEGTGDSMLGIQGKASVLSHTRLQDRRFPLCLDDVCTTLLRQDRKIDGEWKEKEPLGAESGESPSQFEKQGSQHRQQPLL